MSPISASALLAVVATLGGLACEGEPDELFPIVFGGDRPSRIFTPPDYDPARPAPLIIALHGYGSNGEVVLERFDLVPLADEEYVIITAPDGTVDSLGRQFWNGTDACCDFDQSGIDDAGYLVELVDDISTAWSVDIERVYLVGFSGGGFMGYGAVCARADRFAAVVSAAGATYTDFDACAPSEVVDVLQIHGDEDVAITYAGDAFQPGAEGTTLRWAGYNGCAQVPVEQPERIDLDADTPGDETRVEIYPGCPPGGEVELWTAEGSGHDIAFDATFRRSIWAWLEGPR
jgi:polyhydroxybutyrate depolymerase